MRWEQRGDSGQAGSTGGVAEMVAVTMNSHFPGQIRRDEDETRLIWKSEDQQTAWQGTDVPMA